MLDHADLEINGQVAPSRLVSGAGDLLCTWVNAHDATRCTNALLNFGDEDARLGADAIPGAPDVATGWQLLWSVGDQSVGRCLWDESAWRVPGRSGLVLAATAPAR